MSKRMQSSIDATSMRNGSLPHLLALVGAMRYDLNRYATREQQTRSEWFIPFGHVPIISTLEHRFGPAEIKIAQLAAPGCALFSAFWADEGGPKGLNLTTVSQSRHDELRAIVQSTDSYLESLPAASRPDLSFEIPARSEYQQTRPIWCLHASMKATTPTTRGEKFVRLALRLLTMKGIRRAFFDVDYFIALAQCFEDAALTCEWPYIEPVVWEKLTRVAERLVSVDAAPHWKWCVSAFRSEQACCRDGHTSGTCVAKEFANGQ